MTNLKEKNYKNYKLRIHEYAGGIFLSMGIILTIAFTFYNNVKYAVFLTPLIWFILRHQKNHQCIKRQGELLEQFREALVGISTALAAGYSMENSISEAYKEMKLLYGESSLMAEELRIILHKVYINIPLHAAIDQFAGRSGCEEIMSFSEVFSIIRKTGGDMREIIRLTQENIGEKIDTEREIEVIINSKKYEHRIMSVIPLLMIGYIRFSSPGFLNPLYGNLLGIAIMSCCLLIYVFAFLLGEYITRIEV